MKTARVVLVLSLSCLALGCVHRLTMQPPPMLSVQDVQRYPYTVGLFVPPDTRQAIYTKGDSQGDFLEFPIGEQTVLLFKKDLPLVFQEVVEVSSLDGSPGVNLIVQPSIVKFDAVIPYPVYNPWTAAIVYKVDVYDRSHERIYTQTAAGDAQTSKGLLSFMGTGFSGWSLATDAAQMAMDKAMRQLLEGLASAEELQSIKH